MIKLGCLMPMFTILPAESADHITCMIRLLDDTDDGQYFDQHKLLWI